MQNEQTTQSYIRCQAGGAVYALPMLQIRSIERLTLLEEESGEKGQVGWLPTTSERIPVFSLAQRVGQMPTAVLPIHRILVLHHPEHAWGLLVEQVSQLAEVTADQQLPLPKSLQNGRSHFFSGVLKTDAGTALLLNAAQLHPDAIPPEPPAMPEKVAPKPIRPARTGDKAIVIFSLPNLAVEGRPLSFGLSIAQVAEIVDPSEVLPLAGDSPYVQGLVQWRNQSVPLLRLHEPQQGGANGRLRLLIVRAPETGALAALLVRANIRTVELPIPHRPSDRELPIHPLLVSGCVELARETLVIPNIQAALT
ncbi:MAG: chemotaxis protein CheW [Chloroflexota bacterium]